MCVCVCCRSIFIIIPFSTSATEIGSFTMDRNRGFVMTSKCYRNMIESKNCSRSIRIERFNFLFFFSCHLDFHYSVAVYRRPTHCFTPYFCWIKISHKSNINWMCAVIAKTYGQRYQIYLQFSRRPKHPHTIWSNRVQSKRNRCVFQMNTMHQHRPYPIRRLTLRCLCQWIRPIRSVTIIWMEPKRLCKLNPESKNFQNH